MARSPIFHFLQRCIAAADAADAQGLPVADLADRSLTPPLRRRQVLAAAGGLALATAAPGTAVAGAPGDVAVVGAGLAGLHAASLLAAQGVGVRVYEGSDRIGGRCWSIRGVFPGQVAEHGGELIDSGHWTMRRLAKRFRLTLEDLKASPGVLTYQFLGRPWTETEVATEWQAFAPRLRADLRRLSAAPTADSHTADSHTADDETLDRMPLSEYLASRGASPLIRAVIDAAYVTEFGVALEGQSALALLFFADSSRRPGFRPFGSSDERFHIAEGNDGIVRGLAGTLHEPVQLGRSLVRVARQADGRLKLSFDGPAGALDAVHGAAILALPAPLMRQVEFDASVGLPPASRNAIAGLAYGANSKLVIGFTGRPWKHLYKATGEVFSDLAGLQLGWETAPSQALETERGVFTDYSGGAPAEALDPARLPAAVAQALAAMDTVWPGSAAQARRDASGQVVATLDNWRRNPWSLGAYTCNPPGYFTTLEGLYAQPAGGGLCFAGEHTDSFYNFQGFMEGALASGARAADQVLAMTARR